MVWFWKIFSFRGMGNKILGRFLLCTLELIYDPKINFWFPANSLFTILPKYRAVLVQKYLKTVHIRLFLRKWPKINIFIKFLH